MKSIRKAFRNSTDSGHSSEGYSVPNSPNSAILSDSTARTSVDSETPIHSKMSSTSTKGRNSLPNSGTANTFSSVGSNNSPTTSPTSSKFNSVNGVEGNRQGLTNGNSTLGNEDRTLATRNGNTELDDPKTGKSGNVMTSFLPGHNHKDRNITNNFDLSKANHQHHHLGHKTHEQNHHHEIEEVQRNRTHERHFHHIQHHVQPIHLEEHRDEVHHQNEIPLTRISEKHHSTNDDVMAFDKLNSVHRDESLTHPKVREVVDLGENVNETSHHHVQNIIQPIVYKTVHHHHRIHTVIPSHHVSHEAPIIHDSITHPSMSHADFLKSGGKIGSGLSLDKLNLFSRGECERSVEGPGEKMISDYKLGSGSMGSRGAIEGNNTTGTTGTTGGKLNTIGKGNAVTTNGTDTRVSSSAGVIVRLSQFT